MDDLISRKQVLNASHFVACWDGVEHFSLEVVDADFIQKMPSVHPTQSNAQTTQINTLDLINRQDAIEVHCELCPDKYICCPVRNGNICKNIEEFMKIPSVHQKIEKYVPIGIGSNINIKIRICPCCGHVEEEREIND